MFAHARLDRAGASAARLEILDLRRVGADTRITARFTALRDTISMFTGIVKARGTVSAIERRGRRRAPDGARHGLPLADFAVGESIAVNGVCLTARRSARRRLRCRRVGRDPRGHRARQLAVGAAVNLEPALALGERLGGHLVSGHVDCIGRVVSRAPDARSIRLRIEIPVEYARYVAKKGSVTVDGVSLTINEVSGNALRREYHSAYGRRDDRRRLCGRDRWSISRSICWHVMSNGCSAASAAGSPKEFLRGKRLCLRQRASTPAPEIPRSVRSRTSLRTSATARWSSWSTTRTARTRATC